MAGLFSGGSILSATRVVDRAGDGFQWGRTGDGSGPRKPTASTAMGHSATFMAQLECRARVLARVAYTANISPIVDVVVSLNDRVHIS
jgi:hypothetical protein